MMQETRHSMSILVIDDDDRVRTLLRDILQFAGHRVIEASDGESGIRYFEEGESVDMVLTDLGMPLKNGWEVAKWIKTRIPQLPVILITGWGTDLDEEKIKDSGVDLIIGKPFEVNEILDTVNLFMKNY
jgi:DNA-binding response OmpR family regulator